MKSMRAKTIAVGVLAAALVCSVFAQGVFGGQPRQGQGGGQGLRGQGFGRMMGAGMAGMLLQRPDVQRELNLTEQQKTQIRQMQEAMRTAWQETRNLPPQERRQKMEELRQKNDPTKVLNETQKKRLRELELQAMGPMAFLQPEVADELKLTQEQRSRLQGIVMQQMQQLRELWQGGGFGQGQGAQNFQQIREQMEKQMLEVLTPAQRQQWQQMQGKPFQFEGGRPMFWGGMGGFGQGQQGRPRGGSGFGGSGFGN
jgi:Spy/CpxP family protein refolding chaperone